MPKYLPANTAPKSFRPIEKARRAKGLCRCGATPAPGYITCMACIERVKQNYRASVKPKLNALPPKARLAKKWNAIKRAKVGCGHEFSITPDDLEYPTHCPALGLEIDYTGEDPHRSWSIDRLDSSKGYVPGNVSIISRRANTIKSDATQAEVEAVACWLKAVGAP